MAVKEETTDNKNEKPHKRVRQERLINRFTREQVASLLAIHIDAYCKYESGDEPIPDNIIDDLGFLYNKKLTHLKKTKLRVLEVQDED
jgi:hypothetical protein